MTKNPFEELEGQHNVPTEEQQSEEIETKSEELPQTDEINVNSLPNTPVGQAKKYKRESLDGKEVKILSVKMFNPDKENDEIIKAMSNPDTKYYKTKFLLTYDIENSEGVKHREYLSGAIQFIQKDNSISSPLLWFEGSESQVGDLFAKVAKYKNIDPKDLSPREFMNFLNSGPKCLIKDTEVKFNKVVHHKNLVEKFI